MVVRVGDPKRAGETPFDCAQGKPALRKSRLPFAGIIRLGVVSIGKVIETIKFATRRSSFGCCAGARGDVRYRFRRSRFPQFSGPCLAFQFLLLLVQDSACLRPWQGK